jgi:two-component system, OmpR family, phosphate regulon sensor histidine kinase PhoR
MFRFRARLLLALISVIAAVLICSAILIGQLFKSYYLNAFDARLETEGTLLSELVIEKGGLYSFKAEDLNSISQRLNVRMTLVDKNGLIIIDSGEQLLSESDEDRHTQIIKDSIKNNPRLHQILEMKIGQNLHYFGTFIEKNNEIEGYVFLSSRIGEIDQATREIWTLLSISLGIALIIIILLGVMITNRFIKPIEAATNVVIELSKGNYRARTNEHFRSETTSMLGKSINMLASNLQDIVKTQEMQQNRLSTLIENMGSEFLLIDNRGYINLMNKAYKETFNMLPERYLEHLYHEVIEHIEIVRLIEEIFMSEQKLRRQILLQVGIERKYFEVFGSPIINTHNEWKGVLLVFHDITELKKLEQMRKDFVANVSHELKTPITSIKGFSETLLDGAMKNEETLEAFLSIILKESDRLQKLIQDLLELSKIEQHGFHMNIEDIEILLLLDEVCTMLNGKAQEKQISIEITSLEPKPLVKGDYYRLKQVFINLLSNAITYTPTKGSITIKVVEESDTKYKIHVTDTGVGIDKAEIPRIFERFYRVDKDRSRNSGGTGLGLAIVKHILEAHKGNISVTSEVGKGTTFVITLEKSALQ